MPASVIPYLFFGGRCEEAIAFYCDRLGAEVNMVMRYSESPDPVPPGVLPPGFEEKVMHADIQIGGACLMLSDGTHDDGGTFDGFRISLTLPTEADAQSAFDALADGGSVMMPLTKTFWCPCFGMVTDRFGVGWMVSIPVGENG